jgi:hypothetical protein
MKKKTPEDIAAEQERKRIAEAERQERKRLEEEEKARQAFLASPAGQARQAFERGDRVFQYSIDVLNQQAIIIAMIGGRTTKRATDPTDVLNSVCHEGWDLVNGDFVFVQEGQESRDKFLASGQNVAIKGTVLGYYLFKRCEANRLDADSGVPTGARAELPAPMTDEERQRLIGAVDAAPST